MKMVFNKYGILLVQMLLFLPVLGYTTPSKLYDQAIYTGLHNPLVDQAVNDLKYYLQKSTGANFTVSDYNNAVSKGIYLLLDKPGLLSDNLEKKLQNGTVEDFVISGNEDRLLLVATNPKGLSLAIYSYLDQLGIKWYFPGDEWTYIPDLNQILINDTKYSSPSFHIRNFFGTGSIVPVRTVDPSLTLQKKWDDWKRRNRLGGEIQLPGHYGSTFNQKYKAQLEQHPEYLAVVNGQRTSWSVNAKWNISNKDFRTLFIQDRVNYLKDQLNKQKGSTEKVIIAVEPADGYGDCECDSCKRMGTVSDRDFFLANEVAKAVAQISPLAYVNLYAYNTHVAPPSFNLEPNVIVQVIPYAFQRVSSPEALITAWSKRTSNLYIYDYYGIPDWSYDNLLTGGYAPAALVNKIRYWSKMNIRGLMLESSYSIGSTGVGLYLMSKTAWNENENVEAVQTGFYKEMFGKSASLMKAYYDKANGDFRGAADMPYLLNLLDQAMAATNEMPVKDRIQKLQAYLHYVTLYYAWQTAAANQKETTLNNILSYLWQLYPYALVHSTRLTQLLLRNVPGNSTTAQNWNLNTPGNQLKQASFLQNDDLTNLLKKDVTKYPLLENFSYVKKALDFDYSIKSPAPENEKNPKGMSLLDIPATYIRAGKDGNCQFMLKVKETEKVQHQDLLIQCIDPSNGNQVYSQKVGIDGSWKTIAIKLHTDKTYQLIISNNSWIRMSVPADQWIAFKNIPVHAGIDTLWFYVPPTTKYIYYTIGSTALPPVVSDSRKELPTEKINDQNIYRVTVNSASSGKWYNITGTMLRPLQFYQIPDFFFPHPNFTIKPR